MVKVWAVDKNIITEVTLKKQRICDIFLDSTCTGNVSDVAVLPAVMYVIFSIYSLVMWKGAARRYLETNYSRQRTNLLSPLFTPYPLPSAPTHTFLNP
jgi:hypothetical protein